MSNKKDLLSSLIMTLICNMCHSQDGSVKSWAKNQEVPELENVHIFLHIDKSIYQPGETVWISGYLLNRNETLMNEQNTMYILLVDAIKRTLVIHQRFQMIKGRASADITLPDTISPGYYWILGYTNSWLRNDRQPLFRELITVRSSTVNPFRILEGTARMGQMTDTVYARYRIGTSYDGLASGGKFNYTVFSDQDSITSATVLINSFGEVTIPFARYLITSLNSIELVATVNRDSLNQSFILPLFSTAKNNAKYISENQSKDERQVEISSDSFDYHRHSAVRLHIKIFDSLGHALPSFFSLSVVSNRRIDSSRIVWIGKMDEKLEHDYNPTVFNDSKSKIAEGSYLNIPDYGYVLYKGKRLHKPLSLVIMGETFAALETDSTGYFRLPYKTLEASPGSSNYLSVTEKAVDQYKIVVHSLTDELNNRYSKIHYPLNFATTLSLESDDDSLVQPTLGMLKAARVTAKLIDGYNAITGVYRSIHCDHDFVVNYPTAGEKPFRILNSPFDLTGSRPIEGEIYDYIDPKDNERSTLLKKEADGITRRVGSYGYTKKVIYHCAIPPTPPFMTTLQPILKPKVFNLSNGDTSKLGSSSQSTIYWNPSLLTDENGEIVISFYTNDITGSFTCILQGLCNRGTISGKSSFNVKP